MLKGFRDFLFRGNAIDLAVGVIIGAAFTGIVNALAEGLLTPLIALIFGQPDFSTWNVGGFGFGTLVNAIISFVITAVVLYFFIVAPMNTMMKRLKLEEEVEPPAPSMQEKLLTEIRDLQKQQLTAIEGRAARAPGD
ncbi:MAG TPA: large conductance mechanosensitive channel protein MscL [Chloroflexaceae bacterium]|nr:large conductance mechanosensitive channel protein MscL [Chloroflexaceae bacterium]